MVDETTAVPSGDGRQRWWVLIGTTLAVLVLVVASLAINSLLPRDRAATQVRSAVPLGEEFAYLNRVSHWPADWVTAVCAPPLYTLQHYERLPHATVTAACRSRVVAPTGESDNIMIARFPSELPMQVDLHNAGYEWYAFAFDHGSMVVFASVSELSEQDPVTNFGESPFLEPLSQFGFKIYRDPGPP